MSIEIRNLVRTNVRGVTLAAKGVLLALADYANDNGECWPSMDRIAEDVGCTRRSVLRAVERLTRLGYLEVESNRGRNHTNKYRINVPACHIIRSQENVTLGQENVTSRPIKCDIVTENVTFRQIKCDTVSHEPPIEPPKNHQDEPPGTHHAGAREVEPTEDNPIAATPVGGNGTQAGAYRQARAAIKPLVSTGAYANFSEWLVALKAVYPKKGWKLPQWLATWAREHIKPAHWEEIVRNAELYAKSGVVARGYVANLENFLEGEAWLAYGAEEPATGVSQQTGGYANGNGNGALRGQFGGAARPNAPGGSAKYRSDVESIREELDRRKGRRGDGSVYESQGLR